MRSRPQSAAAAITLTLLVLLVPSAVVADIAFPVAWAGVWSLESVHLDCITGDTLSVVSRVDSICPGDPIEQIMDVSEFSDVIDVDALCVGPVDDTQIDVFCTGIYESGGQACANVQWDLLATRSADAMTVEMQLDVQFVGLCSFLFDDRCVEGFVTATRIASDWWTFCPPTPVEPESWGRTKAAYR